MIVNLIGPPCAGKSSFAARFVLEHPYFRYSSIDAHRVEHKDEERAWQEIEKDLLEAEDIVLETSGLSWRLPDILVSAEKRHEILTIAFIGERMTLHRRLEDRQHKRPLPFRYRRMDEHDAIDWVLQNMSNCKYPIDLFIRTDERTQETTYTEVSSEIIKKRQASRRK